MLYIYIDERHGLATVARLVRLLVPDGRRLPIWMNVLQLRSVTVKVGPWKLIDGQRF